MMKAAYIMQYGGSGEVRFGELDQPVPGRDEVVIKMKAASVNPVDWKVREGNLSFITGKKFPKILGTELSGEVEQVGENVRDLKKGDRVFAAIGYKGGAFAEYVKVPEKNVIPIPDALGYEQASTLAVAGVTPLQAFTLHYKVKPGDHVLVNGASGGVGSYAVQIAKVLGAKVTGVCSEKNAEYVRSLGADELIDYNRENFRDRKNAYDVILNAASNATFREVKKSLKKGGMLIHLNLSIKVLMTRFAAMLFSSRRLKIILLKNRHEDVRWLIDRLVSGNINVHIEKQYSLSDAKKALDYSQSGRVRGKIIIVNS